MENPFNDGFQPVEGKDFIDRTNEIIETLKALGTFTIATDFRIYLVSGKAGDKLKKCFKNHNHTLSRYAIISEIDGKHWKITDGSKEYFIEETDNNLTIFTKNKIITITGRRRIGRTSLLKKIKEDFREICVIGDQIISDYNDLIFSVSKCWLEALGKINCIDTADIIKLKQEENEKQKENISNYKRWLIKKMEEYISILEEKDKSHHRIVIMLDDIYGSIDEEKAKLLRDLEVIMHKSNGRYFFILVMFPLKFKKSFRSFPPEDSSLPGLRNKIKEIPVGTMSRKDCEKIIDGGLKKSQIEIKTIKEPSDTYLFKLNRDYKQYLVGGKIGEQLKEAFKDNNCSLSTDVKVFGDEKKWECVDGSKRYIIEDTGTQLYISDIKEYWTTKVLKYNLEFEPELKEEIIRLSGGWPIDVNRIAYYFIEYLLEKGEISYENHRLTLEQLQEKDCWNHIEKQFYFHNDYDSLSNVGKLLILTTVLLWRTKKEFLSANPYSKLIEKTGIDMSTISQTFTRLVDGEKGVSRLKKGYYWPSELYVKYIRTHFGWEDVDELKKIVEMKRKKKPNIEKPKKIVQKKKPEPDMKEGYIYLFDEAKPVKSYKAFNYQINKKKRKALCISRNLPNFITQEHAINFEQNKIEFIYLSSEERREISTIIKPTELPLLQKLIIDFVRENSNSIIIMDALNFLIQKNDNNFDIVYNILSNIKNEIWENQIIFILPFNPTGVGVLEKEKVLGTLDEVTEKFTEEI